MFSKQRINVDTIVSEKLLHSHLNLSFRVERLYVSCKATLTTIHCAAIAPTAQPRRSNNRYEKRQRVVPKPASTVKTVLKTKIFQI